MLDCFALLDKYYAMDNNMQNLDHECMEEFVKVDLNDEYENFEDLYEEINKVQIKKTVFKEKKSLRLEKIIGFTYLKIMNMPKNKQIDRLPISSNFFRNIANVLCDKHILHHSHIKGEIIGYAHGFYYRNVRENKNITSLIAHNLFGFDFFFLIKGIRLSVWKTKDISMGGSNLTNINFANINKQIKFIDTIKSYQQSLAKLAESMTVEEKEKIKKESKGFIKKYEYFGEIFASVSKQDQEWILDYMCSGKGVILYKILIITDEEYQQVKKFYSLLKMRNLET